MFYVYELRDGERPFYVGKGSKNRINQHEIRARRGIRSHTCAKIRKIWRQGRTVGKAVVFSTDNEEAAFAEERRLIAYYGRRNLTNKTDGGDGVANPTKAARAKIAAGRRGAFASLATRHRQRLAKLGTHRSEATKRKIAASLRGTRRPWARETALRNLPKMSAVGRKWTEEQRKKFRAARLGHIVTKATRKKISNSRKGIIPWNKKTLSGPQLTIPATIN